MNFLLLAFFLAAASAQTYTYTITGYNATLAPACNVTSAALGPAQTLTQTAPAATTGCLGNPVFGGSVQIAYLSATTFRVISFTQFQNCTGASASSTVTCTQTGATCVANCQLVTPVTLGGVTFNVASSFTFTQSGAAAILSATFALLALLFVLF